MEIQATRLSSPNNPHPSFEEPWAPALAHSGPPHPPWETTEPPAGNSCIISCYPEFLFQHNCKLLKTSFYSLEINLGDFIFFFFLMAFNTGKCNVLLCSAEAGGFESLRGWRLPCRFLPGHRRVLGGSGVSTLALSALPDKPGRLYCRCKSEKLRWLPRNIADLCQELTRHLYFQN